MALDPTSMPTVVNRFGSTTLFEDVTADAETIILSDGGNLPSGSEGGCIQIDSEIIYFATRIDNILYGCRRGEDGTVARGHSRGDVVTSQIVAGNFNGLKAAVLQLEAEMDGSSKREVVVVTHAMLQATSFALSSPPVSIDSVQVVPVGGPMQLAGIDYDVEGNLIKWNGLGLDGTLEAGDIIQVFYKV